MSASKVIEVSIHRHTWVHVFRFHPPYPFEPRIKEQNGPTFHEIRILLHTHYNSPHNWVKIIPEKKKPFREPFFHCLIELPVLCRMIIVGLGDLFWG